MTLSERLQRARNQRLLAAGEQPEDAAVDRTVEDERATLCPTCARPGTVDLVDLIGHRRHLRCEVCGSMWEVEIPDS